METGSQEPENPPSSGAAPIDKHPPIPQTTSEVVPSNPGLTEVDLRSNEEKIDHEQATGNNAVEDEIPDVEMLTIKNLDTGEQFVIGENDPDFDFDTFELRGGVEATPIIATKEQQDEMAEAVNGNNGANAQQEGLPPAKSERKSFWLHFLNVIYGSKSSKKKEEQAKLANDFTVMSKPKTPFTKLSNFKFRKELGRGAFGRVLLAESKLDGKLFALKIITKKNMRTSDKRQAKAERDILHSMTLKAPHPFTSGLKFAFQSENNLYLGMDFIPGGNLRELIKKFKFLPEDWVRFYAAELVLAISHLHSLNVLYRDIKPHNVMIDARGHLILIDFGLSKQEIFHPRGALSLVGTPDYSAPEVLKTGVQQIEAHNRERNNAAGGGGGGKKSPQKGGTVNPRLPPKMGYGKAADWWSLGIMIYEMLSGTPTFRGADLRQTYQKILYADLEFVPEERFSMSARLLLQGMIKRDPSTRMGAWENPPQDIMSAPFFGGIQWDAIYERRFDGPYVPEVQIFGSKSKKSTNGSPAPGSGDSSGKEEDGSGGQDSRGNDRVGRPKSGPAQQGGVGGAESGGEEGEDEEEEEEDEDSGSELKGMRDSVFIRPHDATGNNLLDWSFIDEKVLAETCADGEPGKKKRKKKRSKRAPSGAEAPAAQDAAAQSELNIIEKIETKQVAFGTTTASAAAPASGTGSTAIASDASPVQGAEPVVGES